MSVKPEKNSLYYVKIGERMFRFDIKDMPEISFEQWKEFSIPVELVEEMESTKCP